MPKIHKVWPGNNRFYFNCCITGPGRDTPKMVFIYICQIAMITTFSIFFLKPNWAINPILPILFYISITLFNIFLLMTACSDPGIIPRRPFLQKDHEKYKEYLHRT